MTKTKPKIRFEKKDNGVTIWVNDRWVLDASTFKMGGRIDIDVERMELTGVAYNDKLVFRLRGEKP